MPKFGTSTWRITSVVSRYGLAVLSVAAALSVRELIRFYFEPTPNAFFFCAVAFSSWFGGLGPGLVASLLSVSLIDYHFSSSYHPLGLSAEDVPRALVFFI